MPRQGVTPALSFEIPQNFESVEQLQFWFTEVLQEVVEAHNLLAEGYLPVLHAAPDKPQTGRIVFADGTDWNPGSGRGTYVYDEDAVGWSFLG